MENYFILKPQEIVVGDFIKRKITEESPKMFALGLRDFPDLCQIQWNKLKNVKMLTAEMKIEKLTTKAW